jgi:hypothetical protein
MADYSRLLLWVIVEDEERRSEIHTFFKHLLV